MTKKKRKKGEIMYFSYDPNGDGLQLHETDDAAKKAANDALTAERDAAYAGWSEEVAGICWGICWGKIYGRAVQTKDEPAPHGSGFDRYLDYEIQPT